MCAGKQAATYLDFYNVMGPRGAPKKSCSQEQAVSVGTVLIFLFSLPFVVALWKNKCQEQAPSNAPLLRQCGIVLNMHSEFLSF